MGMWTVPAIITVILLCAYAYYVTIQVAKKVEQGGEHDVPIHEAIKDHPLLLNPIILMYVIVGILMTIMIFYYWSSYPS